MNLVLDISNFAFAEFIHAESMFLKVKALGSNLKVSVGNSTTDHLMSGSLKSIGVVVKTLLVLELILKVSGAIVKLSHGKPTKDELNIKL